MGVIVKLSLAMQTKLALKGIRELWSIRELVAAGNVYSGMARLVRLYITIAEKRGASHHSESDVDLLTHAAVETYNDMKAHRARMPIRDIGRAVKKWVWAWRAPPDARSKAKLLAAAFPERLLAR